MKIELTTEQRAELEVALDNVKSYQTDLWSALALLEDQIDALDPDAMPAELDANTDYDPYDVDSLLEMVREQNEESEKDEEWLSEGAEEGKPDGQ